MNQIRLGHKRGIVMLGRGGFIGSVALEADTPSFAFRRMRGTVPAREVPRHSHDTAYFFFVIHGRYATEAHGTTDVCERGAVIFNPTGTTHRDHFVDEDGEFLAISIPPDLERQFALTVPVSTVLRDPVLRATVAAAATELRSADRDSAFVLQTLGLQLVAQLAPMTPLRGQPPWLRRVRDQLRDRVTRGWSVADVAAAVGVHPVYLARVFRQHHRCSPGEYMRAWRVERARRLIVSSSRPLAEIALDVGFYDQSQLSNDFRRVTGLSPREYRWRFAPGAANGDL
jgi:AraC family transcriptional regulator